MILNFIFSSLMIISVPLVENHSYSHPEDKYNNGYTEKRFDTVLDKVIEVYTPIIENRGGTFYIDRIWSDGAVNMWAEKWGDQYRLEIPGGMARYHLFNEEGFLHSICHELGHLLGGAPGNNPISFEGQSDYFSSLQCMKILLPTITPEIFVPAPTEISEACEGIPHIEKNTCHRSLMGALSLTSYYAELEKVPAPTIKTPSQVVVTKTLDIHPAAQCRFDTMYAGLSCDQDTAEELSFLDPNKGTCSQGNRGGRPACWFKN